MYIYICIYLCASSPVCACIHLSPWVLHLTVPPRILPLFYLELLKPFLRPLSLPFPALYGPVPELLLPLFCRCWWYSFPYVHIHTLVFFPRLLLTFNTPHSLSQIVLGFTRYDVRKKRTTRQPPDIHFPPSFSLQHFSFFNFHLFTTYV